MEVTSLANRDPEKPRPKQAIPGEGVDRADGSFDRRLRDILGVLLIKRVIEPVDERHEERPDVWKQQAPRGDITVLAPPAERFNLLEFRFRRDHARAIRSRMRGAVECGLCEFAHRGEAVPAHSWRSRWDDRQSASKNQHGLNR